MANSRQILSPRSLYGAVILATMACAVAWLLHRGRDRLDFKGQHEWRRIDSSNGVFAVELPTTWHYRQQVSPDGTVQMIAFRSEDTLLAVVGAPLADRLPARVPTSTWRRLALQAHESNDTRLVIDNDAPLFKEFNKRRRQAHGAVYFDTELSWKDHQTLRDISRWGRRVTMVSRRGLCIVECVTREARKKQMEPVFARVIKSLRPGR